MGWASGSDVAIKMIYAIRIEKIDEEAKARLYTALIKVLRDADWDAEDEALEIDPLFDKILRKKKL